MPTKAATSDQKRRTFRALDSFISLSLKRREMKNETRVAKLSGAAEAAREQGGRDDEFLRRDLHVALRLALFANHIREAELGDGAAAFGSSARRRERLAGE